MNEFVYGEPLGPRVIEAIPNDNYEITLTFDNGERRKFDARPLLKYEVFSKLKDRDFFKALKVEYGTIMWADDIDYCPDTLYEQSVLVA